MRLLNSESLEFEEFFQNPPPYAILSHTWGAEELSHANMLNRNATIQARQGYAKIRGCCALARKDGYKYVWIDTICIDKTSSAELSEAINSMFNWYRDSSVCYVYLSDVNCTSTGHGWLRSSEDAESFKSSRWFSRGWTLQELIAPARIEFFSCNWVELGTKASLERQLEEATGIRLDVLRGASPSICSAAERMSWASNRHTTRIEDIAYSLLGIFSINMPLLYGEGKNAFFRLQLEILRQNEDYSLFAFPGPWTPGPRTCTAEKRGTQSSLAPSPHHFDPRSLQQALDTANDDEDSRADSRVDSATGMKPSLSWSSFANFRQFSHWTVRERAVFDKISSPATVTNRGLQLDVLAEEWGEHLDLLVWTSFVNIQLDAYLCCLFHREPYSDNASASTDPPPITRRAQGPGLVIVPFEVLKYFRRRTLFVRPYEAPESVLGGLTEVLPCWTCYNSVIWSAEERLVLEDSCPLEGSTTGPSNGSRTAMNETNNVLAVGILRYRLTRRPRKIPDDKWHPPIRIAVLLGHYGSKLWCAVRSKGLFQWRDHRPAWHAYAEFDDEVKRLPPLLTDRVSEITPSGDMVAVSLKYIPNRVPLVVRIEVSLFKAIERHGSYLRVAKLPEVINMEVSSPGTEFAPDP
ncbi:heterokaryon incompatibility protein-domain-containing protein [Cercophora newfieldiana]|uniref:Heterokaryon incompatibility protein-domain-containing protein n=1 Tax=Cercophora newfieldiana TaxID=92897 RepID=A0AA39XZK6_9PEZI|nr:heterokaryon incompatibility protein-domain-containing protein [Cercophora newfieldiana]